MLKLGKHWGYGAVVVPVRLIKQAIRLMMMRQGTGVWRCLRDGDYQEQDVWDVLSDMKPPNSMMLENLSEKISTPPCLVVGRNPPSGSAARMIQISSESSCNDNETKLMVQHSAPVNIHDWSKMMSGKKQQQQPPRKTYKHSNLWIGFEFDDDEEDEYEGDDIDDEYGSSYNKEPPHEMIARRMASSQISSFSVFEGLGRTLKGRDLSKVRNAVLSRTGFLESCEKNGKSVDSIIDE